MTEQPLPTMTPVVTRRLGQALQERLTALLKHQQEGVRLDAAIARNQAWRASSVATLRSIHR